MRSLAIIGLSSSRTLAPISDDAWETWGLGNDPRCELYDRVFEMHPPYFFDGEKRARVERQLEEMENLYHQGNYPATDWAWGYDSSIAYMLALGIHYCFRTIGLWGVDMARDEEYAYQRENMMHMLGFARGRGIEIVLPPQSKLHMPVNCYPFGFESIIHRS